MGVSMYTYHGRKLSQIARYLNCDSSDEYYGLRDCIRGYYLYTEKFVKLFVLSGSVIHQCINLAVARGFGRQILEISNFTKGRHLAFVAHNQCSCRLVRLAD